jgi:hypothetical protein
VGATNSDKSRMRQLDGKAGAQNAEENQSLNAAFEIYPDGKYDWVKVYSAMLYRTQRSTSEIRP